MKVLLTGADGNLGTALRRAQGTDFIPIGRTDWPRVSEVLTSGVDAVLHLAWDLKTPVTSRPEAVFEANVMTTMRLLEACRTAGIPKFALMSTGAVYGDSHDTSEDAPCCPVTINGITKLLNERVVESFCASARIECQIYRVFNMYGGDDHFSILSHLQRALDQGTPFRLNNRGVAERDFIHVDDVARIVLTLLERTLPGVHVNIGSGVATRIADVVDAVRRLHPELAIAHQSVAEAPYSRADIGRLTSIAGELHLTDVMAFITHTFGVDGRTG